MQEILFYVNFSQRLPKVARLFHSSKLTPFGASHALHIRQIDLRDLQALVDLAVVEVVIEANT